MAHLIPLKICEHTIIHEKQCELAFLNDLVKNLLDSQVISSEKGYDKNQLNSAELTKQLSISQNLVDSKNCNYNLLGTYIQLMRVNVLKTIGDLIGSFKNLCGSYENKTLSHTWSCNICNAEPSSVEYLDSEPESASISKPSFTITSAPGSTIISESDSIITSASDSTIKSESSSTIKSESSSTIKITSAPSSAITSAPMILESNIKSTITSSSQHSSLYSPYIAYLPPPPPEIIIKEKNDTELVKGKDGEENKEKIKNKRYKPDRILSLDEQEKLISSALPFSLPPNYNLFFATPSDMVSVIPNVVVSSKK